MRVASIRLLSGQDKKVEQLVDSYFKPIMSTDWAIVKGDSSFWTRLMQDMIKNYVIIGQQSKHATYERPGKKENPQGFNTESACMVKLIDINRKLAEDEPLIDSDIEAVYHASRGLIDVSIENDALTEEDYNLSLKFWSRDIQYAFPEIVTDKEAGAALQRAVESLALKDGV